MEELKQIVACNIINLRTSNKMTQAELGDLLSYSDKSVSKWERGESLPDVTVLKKLSEIFGVTIDYLTERHDDFANNTPIKEPDKKATRLITLLVIVGVWTCAFLVFIIMWILNKPTYYPFLYTLPVSFITHLVLNSVWEKGKHNYFIIAGLIFSIILIIYCSFPVYNIWQIFILLIPTVVIIFLSSLIKKRFK